MPRFHLSPRGLFLKLCVFFLALALPALLLVEGAVVWLEFRAFSQAVDAGAMQRAVAAEAAALASRVARARDDRERLDDALAAWLLRLERPREGIGEQESYVLLELAREPLAAVIVGADGRLLASAPRGRDGENLRRAAMASQLVAGEAMRIGALQSPEFVRQYAVPLSDGARLALELRVPLPWRRLALSFEWPIMLAFLGLFAGASALFIGWYVTRRLHAIEHAAAAWRRGDFGQLIVDRSGDELGRLAGELNRMAGDLRELFDTRESLAALAERARLARDLHDTVKQKAFALSLQLATLQARQGTPESSATLVEARRLAEQIQRELAQVIDELRPPRDGGFCAQLGARAQDFARQSAIDVQADVGAADAVPPGQQLTLLRALDEALSNVQRHSRAQHVVLMLRREGPRFALEVRDDGRGVVGEPRAGYGLGNLRERALSLPGGRFDWQGTAGAGVALRISWDAPDGAPP